jgi:hypothetical protein
VRQLGYDYSMSFDNCTFGDDGDVLGTCAAITIEGVAVPTRRLTINNCRFYHTNGFVSATSLASVSITNNTMNMGGSTFDGIALKKVITRGVISNNTINNTGTRESITLGAGVDRIDCDWIFITNNTITSVGGGITSCDAASSNCKLWVENNKVQITATTGAPKGIECGEDIPATPQDMAYEWGMVVCRNNTVTHTTNNIGHSILIGPNVVGGDISYNTCSGGNTQLVIKGKGLTVHHNFLSGTATLLIKMARNCTISNNTCYATKGYALGICSQLCGTQYYAQNNQIYNNIFYSADTTSYVLSTADDYELPGPNNNYVDYNCYRYTSSFALINGHPDIATFADMKAYWPAWSAANFPTNDANSIVGEPGFRNATSGDLSLTGSSPCINAGRASAGSYTTMGAYQPKVEAAVIQ